MLIGKHSVIFFGGSILAFNIVLVEPEIPQNTGNSARTCAATGTRLHLVKPFGFTIDDKQLKRAGLDYWHLVDIVYYESLEDFLKTTSDKRRYFLSTKGNKRHSDIVFKDEDYLIFGKETAGLPKHIVDSNFENTLRVPMIDEARSLNLSNSVAVVIYEALRQTDFVNLR